MKALLAGTALAAAPLVYGGDTYNFNPGWLLNIGDPSGAETVRFDDSGWKPVTLPRAFNEDEAFRIPIAAMTDTVAWYRKHFRLPKSAEGKKIFIEFEGARQGADVYLNGHHLGLHENGVMAFGFDITPYVEYGKENTLAVRTDNDWRYKERATGTNYQWNDKNFNANYGGLPKNVTLHVMEPVYQTLPLLSSLGTTGIYIYPRNIDVKKRKADINVESQVENTTASPVHVTMDVTLTDPDGKKVASFTSKPYYIAPGQRAIVSASDKVEGLHFWSWGYGYLYDVTTTLNVDGKPGDTATTRTGFRKTDFGKGQFKLNDRTLMVHGYAQRSSNEWPGVGMSVPPWLSDLSNLEEVRSGGNLVRWMHITPWKQDVESCDRVGLIQAMPAGDSERDSEGRKWEQRVELMADAIVYNRNNPSVIFYESGNKGVSEPHICLLYTSDAADEL